MKNLKWIFKSVAIILLTHIVILKGITLYKNESVSLTQAVNENSKVKIKTTNDKTYKFQSIEFQNGVYPFR